MEDFDKFESKIDEVMKILRLMKAADKEKPVNVQEESKKWIKFWIYGYLNEFRHSFLFFTEEFLEKTPMQ